jgi:hypothetical protein
MAEAAPDTASKPKTPADDVTYWVGQLAAYDDEFKPWKDRCRKIIRRYRDERSESSTGNPVGGDRFNALWSNVQVLMPAIYSQSPQPVVERRYRAKDPLARISSMTLERACEVQMEIGHTHPAMKRVMLDYLLCGRGTTWERYEPTFGEPQDLAGDAPGGDDDDATQDAAGSTSLTEPEGGEEQAAPVRPVTFEKVNTDYVAWDKFRHSPAAQWDEVWWVSKDEMLTRKELRDRFKGIDEDSGKPIADLIPMRANVRDKDDDREKKRRNPRALVVEIWNKRDRKVIFIAPDWPNAPLEIAPDPLSLQNFFPCPPPLYATITNDSLVPVPDYVEYQDQADELDSLSARIKALTDAVRVNGVYDASIPELKRILQEGVDNRLIGVKNWAELVTKGGISKAMDFVPLDMIVKALLTLHESFDKAKAKLDEITGISDIIRGQSVGAAKTATEQRIKGQYAALRIEDRKKDAARLARDTIAIKGEIIAEQFSTEILAEMTGMIPFLVDEIKLEMPSPPLAPQAPSPSPMMGHNGGPPLSPIAAPGAPAIPGAAAMPAGAAPPIPFAAPGGLPLAPPPPPDPQVLAQQRFEQACELLRNDKMRTFRIDIETNSTVEPDRQAAKEAVSEMFMSVGQFLEKGVMLGQVMPEAVPALGQSILFAMRTFGAGRDVEAAWEAAIDKLDAKVKNPPPPKPSPDEIKAKAAEQQAATDAAAATQQFQFDQQRNAMQLQADERKHAMELEKMQAELQLKREEIQVERERLAMDKERAQFEAMTEANRAAREERSDVRKAQIDEASDTRAAEQGEREHELGLEVMEAKAAQAKKPKGEAA